MSSPPERTAVVSGQVVADGAAPAAVPTAVAAQRPQVIVVTGCTSGLGLSLVREFSRMGHIVAGCGRRTDVLDQLREEMKGTRSSFHVVDVSKEDQVAAFAAEAERLYGDVDMVIANAGAPTANKMPWDISDSHVHTIVDVSLKGVMFTNAYFIPIMLRGLQSTPDGPVKRIINISSGIAHTSMPWAADYAAVKCGVEGYSKCVAQSFTAQALDKSHPGVAGRILCVPFAPGVVLSGMNKLPGNPTADEWCKDAAPYLLQIPVSENGSSLTMPGYYSVEYRATWIVPDGAKVNSTWTLPSAR